MQKTADSLEDLESRLEAWLTEIENKVAEVSNRPEATPTPDNNFIDIFGKLNSTESNLIEEMARLKTSLHDNTAKREKDSSALMEKTRKTFSEVIYCTIKTIKLFLTQIEEINRKEYEFVEQVQDVAAKIGDIEISLERIKQMAQTIQEKPVEQKDSIMAVDEHFRTLVRVQELLEETSYRIQELPR